MSARLELIAKQINKDEKVLDVGTDHGLLPILLIDNKITKNIIASDVNIGPLNAAKKNIEDKGYQNDVQLVLTSGLNNIDVKDMDVIVIAGMGATTIGNIISEKSFDGRYIIHSTTHITDVRKYIQEIGHTIINEWVDQEGKIYNIVIETKKGSMNLNEKEMYLGPILMKKRKESESYYAFLLRTLIKNSEKSGIKNLKIREREWLKEQLWNE